MKTLIDLVAKNNRIFKRLCIHKLYPQKELKYFIYNFKKATNLGKLYFLPKIHRRLSAVPCKPVISNCGTRTEKVAEYLVYIFKPLMQESWSYIKGSGDFLKKIKNIDKISEGAILVTVDVIGLYPSISHGADVEALRKILSERDSPKDIVRMVEFVLKNNFFEFNGEVKRQKS